MKINTISMALWMSLQLLCQHQDPDFISSPPVLLPGDEVAAWSRTFAELIYHVQTKYYLSISPRDAMFKAMNAFVSFDPHSTVLDPAAYNTLVLHEEFRIGVTLAPKQRGDATITITDVLPESPAEKASLQPLDRIIAIDNKTIIDLSNQEIMQRLRSKEKSPVSLTLLCKDGSLKTITLMRSPINNEDIYAYLFQNQHIVYLAIVSFTDNVVHRMEHILRQALTMNIRGIIVDVRGNCGGSLPAVTECLGFFLPKDSLVVTTKDRYKHTLDTFKTSHTPIIPLSLPSIIVVDQTTASAAEIFAARLAQQNDRLVFTVGVPTFGKGSVQEVLPLSNNCALKLTTALYELPNNVIVQNQGIQPDFIIEQRSLPSKEERALKNLFFSESSSTHSIIPADTIISSQPTTQPIKSQREQRIIQDYQIQQSIILLQCINYAREVRPKDIGDKFSALSFLKKMIILDTTTIKELSSL